MSNCKLFVGSSPELPIFLEYASTARASTKEERAVFADALARRGTGHSVEELIRQAAQLPGTAEREAGERPAPRHRAHRPRAAGRAFDQRDAVVRLRHRHRGAVRAEHDVRDRVRRRGLQRNHCGGNPSA